MIAVVYNEDYDASSGADATSVADSARAVAGALRAKGRDAELVGVRGRELLAVVERLCGASLVFNLCESLAGDARNEPTFVGLLDLFGIPYTGTDLPGLAACLYKHRAKDLLVGAGVPTPPHRVFVDEADLDGDLASLDFPWFVKLAHEDASIGITEANVVGDAAALRARATELMRAHRQPVLAERFVDGREVNATLVGNGADVRVLPLHEIDFAAMPGERPKIVSYAAKWDEAHVDYAGTKPVPLRAAAPALVARCEAAARGAWRALGLRDYGRVDLRVDAAGQPWVIDVNPNPDLSPDAGVVRAAAAAGIAYDDLIARIADFASARSHLVSRG